MKRESTPSFNKTEKIISKPFLKLINRNRQSQHFM